MKKNKNTEVSYLLRDKKKAFEAMYAHKDIKGKYIFRFKENSTEIKSIPKNCCKTIEIPQSVSGYPGHVKISVSHDENVIIELYATSVSWLFPKQVEVVITKKFCSELIDVFELVKKRFNISPKGDSESAMFNIASQTNPKNTLCGLFSRHSTLLRLTEEKTDEIPLRFGNKERDEILKTLKCVEKFLRPYKAKGRKNKRKR